MVRLGGPDGMRKEGKGHLFDVGWGMVKKGWVRLMVKVWRSSGRLQIHQPQMTKAKGMKHLVDEGWQLEKWRHCWRLVVLTWNEVWR